MQQGRGVGLKGEDAERENGLHPFFLGIRLTAV